MKAMVLGLSLAAVLAAVIGLSLALSPNAGGGECRRRAQVRRRRPTSGRRMALSPVRRW